MADRSYAAIQFGPVAADQLQIVASVLSVGAVVEGEKEGLAGELLAVILDTPDTVVVTGNMITLEFYEAAWGAAEVREWGLPELLREKGIGYDFWDDGKYEYDGSIEEWRPGMDGPWEAGKLNNGDAVVGRQQYAAMKKKNLSAAQLIADLDRAFGAEIPDLVPAEAAAA